MSEIKLGNIPIESIPELPLTVDLPCYEGYENLGFVEPSLGYLNFNNLTNNVSLIIIFKAEPFDFKQFQTLSLPNFQK